MPDVQGGLNRRPWIVAVVVLLGLGVAMWSVRNYIQHTLRPRQEAALQARIAEAVNRAQGRYQLGKFARALEDYQHVLRSFDGDLGGEAKGKITNGIGLCYLGLAEQNDAEANLGPAVTAFREALGLLPAAEFPVAHASTQTHLGDAYRLGFLTDLESQEADRAIEAYRSALELYATEENAVAQARTLNRIGNVYRDLHAKNSSAMEEALRTYDQARKALETQPDAAVLGETHANIGLAYLTLARADSSSRNLKRAIGQFDRALVLLDAEASRREFGAVHRHLGDAYTLLAEARPSSSTNRALHTQNVIAYRNKAKAAYRIAENFGTQASPPAPAEKQ